MAARIDNPQGRGSVLLLCCHASNHVPESFAGLGLSEALLADHVAWDIGALAVAQRLSLAIDAPLVSAPASRLLVDPNRSLNAPDLIVQQAEGQPVPGNLALSDDEREARLDAYHAPYHEAIDSLLDRRGDIQALVSIHSFTPLMNGTTRPWHAGVLHAADSHLADRLIDALSAHEELIIGRNQPYAPTDGVYYTLERHGTGRMTAMIEVRNDQLGDEAGQARWAELLAGAISAAVPVE